jgi:hypothetical protein
MRLACVVVVTTTLAALVACSSSSGPSGGAPDDGGGTPALDGGDAAASVSDSGLDVSPGFPDDHGPGIYGALPSGYCCTKDADCKGRYCADQGGGKMCLDSCSDASDCDVPKTPFACAVPAGETVKRCMPPAGVKCVAAADFVRGKKAFGDCCVYRPGQVGGAECASHLCGGFGDGNPYLCTSHCETQADCPSDFKCELSGGAGWVPTCLPLAVYSGGTYTCK